MANKKKLSPFEEAQALVPECIDLDNTKDYEGLTLVLNPRILKKEHRNRESMIWKVTGGFGCNPELIGKSTFATCLHDGEKARFYRNEWAGEIPSAP